MGGRCYPTPGLASRERQSGPVVAAFAVTSEAAVNEHRLQREIAELVVARQSLRAHGATDAALERNRRQLVRLQREFALALIARHRLQAEQSAA